MWSYPFTMVPCEKSRQVQYSPRGQSSGPCARRVHTRPTSTSTCLVHIRARPGLSLVCSSRHLHPYLHNRPRSSCQHSSRQYSRHACKLETISILVTSYSYVILIIRSRVFSRRNLTQAHNTTQSKIPPHSRPNVAPIRVHHEV